MGWSWGWGGGDVNVHLKFHTHVMLRWVWGGVGVGVGVLDRQWHHVKKSVPKQWTTTSKGKIREREISGNTYGVDSGVASMRATSSRAWVSSAKTNGMEGRKKYLKFKLFQTGSADTWENTMISDESTHFERAFPRFCTCECQ